jgi:hypothetical protein
VQPSASPSGRTCDITTNRCFDEGDRAISVSDLFVMSLAASLGFGSFRGKAELLENLQDSIPRSPEVIQLEVEAAAST